MRLHGSCMFSFINIRDCATFPKWPYHFADPAVIPYAHHPHQLLLLSVFFLNLAIELVYSVSPCGFSLHFPND